MKMNEIFPKNFHHLLSKYFLRSQNKVDLFESLLSSHEHPSLLFVVGLASIAVDIFCAAAKTSEQDVI